MNKQDLIGKVAEVTGMQKSDSEKAVNAVFDQITDVLKARGEVRLVGFGTFKTSIRSCFVIFASKNRFTSIFFYIL